jgi:hypothetical protein
MATNPPHPPRRHHAHPSSWPQSRPSSTAMATDLTTVAGGRGRVGRGRRSSPCADHGHAASMAAISLRYPHVAAPSFRARRSLSSPNRRFS